MPVIDRPNTDQQRLEAMEAAKAKADVTAPADLAFSAATLALLTAFLPTFRTAMQSRGSALGAQSAATNVADLAKAKLKLFITHFFEVFNRGILREVYTSDQRAHFQLPVSQDTVPRLVTEHELNTWGERITTGDAARVTAGGAAMSNPTAAEVTARHTAFVTAQGTQSTQKDAYDAGQEAVAGMREEADGLIHEIADEVEFAFRHDSPSSKRRKAREYGLVYRPAPGETPHPDDFSIIGSVKNSDTSAPLAGALLRIVELNISGNTDAEGKFYIQVLAPGTYTIQVVKAGFQSTEITGVVVVAGEITTLNITLPPNPAGTGSVSGQVTVGAGVQPCTVSVNGTAITTTTDPSGNYSLTNVPGGSQIITATVISDPANFDTEFINVVVGSNVIVNFNL